jgi:hypothetical protein
MLNILQPVEYEETINKKEFRTYLPYNDNSYNANDEVRINVNNLDFVLLNESYIHVELKVDTVSAADTGFTDYLIPFLFSEIKLEMNGICSAIMKSLTLDEAEKISSSEYIWSGRHKKDATRDFIFPLADLLNFAKDYKKLIIFSRLELILVRGKSDNNCFVIGGDTASTATLRVWKIRWVVPHIHPEEVIKLKLLKTLEHGTSISMPFRSVEFHEHPGIPTTTETSWQVKTTTTRPLFILVGLQTGRKDNTLVDPASFDHCSIRNCRLYLNSEVYPYEGMNLDFDNDKYTIAYKMMQHCRKSLCDREGAVITREEFKNKLPLICFDVSHFNANVKSMITDIKVQLEFNKAPKPATTICLLIVAENIIHYNPFTNVVQKE